MKMRTWEISGWYLCAVGVIHSLVGVMMFKDELLDMVRAGIVNSIKDQMDLHAAFWFMLTGFLFIYIGWLWQKQIDRDKGPLSKFTASGMTLMTVAGVIIMPISGFWLLLPLCVIMLHSTYAFKHSERAGSDG